MFIPEVNLLREANDPFALNASIKNVTVTGMSNVKIASNKCVS
jgi:hypothetical protein